MAAQKLINNVEESVLDILGLGNLIFTYFQSKNVQVRGDLFECSSESLQEVSNEKLYDVAGCILLHTSQSSSVYCILQIRVHVKMENNRINWILTLRMMGNLGKMLAKDVTVYNLVPTDTDGSCSLFIGQNTKIKTFDFFSGGWAGLCFFLPVQEDRIPNFMGTAKKNQNVTIQRDMWVNIAETHTHLEPLCSS